MPSTHQFTTTLTAGNKPPYDRWTFLVLPAELATAWGRGAKAVCGTINGAGFRGTASRGEGVLRMPVPREVRDAAGVAVGDTVAVEIALDAEPRRVTYPAELRAMIDADPELVEFERTMSDAHRRAWAEYVGSAKRPETRERRAGLAAEGIRRRAFPGER